MSELHLPWLELSVLLPLVGGIWVSLLKNRDRARTVCTIVCAVTLVCAIGEWLDFAMLGTFEAHDHWDLFQSIFHRDVFVIDELSAPLLPLGALLYLTTEMTTLRTKSNRFSFHWTLVSESILLATLACRSPWLIITLLAIATIPPWLELRKRGQCTRVFVIHMALFVTLLVAGQALAGATATSANPPILAGCLLTAGALLRSGVCPLHCWMTDLFEKATFGTALLFVTPMTGAYAVMRLVFPIAPSWALQSIAILSLVTAIYAAGMALVQRDSRRFFCYLFLSHSSLVLVGLEMATPIGLAGALCVWLSVGISLLGFGLALRCVEARTGRLTLDNFHGLYEHTPFLAAMFLLTGLASIGFPGTVGFIGTELLVEGAVEVYPFVGLAVVVAAAMNGVAIVKAYFHVFTGIRHTSTVKMDCRPSERITILVMVVLIIGGGLIPQPGVQSRYHAAQALLDHRSVEQADDSDGSDGSHSAHSETLTDNTDSE
ncbi:proton-conducting transporter transmembrane domain-containing protein [Stratiformator vulcanicus]|uniref:NAD(P)H-quinone oxidoreductase chain 4 1 n=1 Tax=Stratiformator vulcanicus TaxID=2527980 RepID=A0A517R3D9_9PLAN|nr:proton-conducting transporter membrane subunit [Stratiformator vulcanicus]QDT38367.1 NAD(P)H-quinone oxidoreductase chain 4 1 [Stratiformator vulcanicus]